MLWIFLVITVLSVTFFVIKKKAMYLAIPFITIFVFFIIQIAMVPLSFVDTVKFIFSLR